MAPLQPSLQRESSPQLYHLGGGARCGHIHAWPHRLPNQAHAACTPQLTSSAILSPRRLLSSERHSRDVPHKRHLCNPASLRLSAMKTRLPVLLLYTWPAKALLGALLSLLVQEATAAGCGGLVRACHPGTQKVEAGSSEVQGLCCTRFCLKQKQIEKGQTSHAPHSLYSKEALGRVSGGAVMSSAAGLN